ncbi:transcriptional regulator with XRE-family HTH domain [Amycolatopsis lexingtonensis]|uniref:Transcriptional regulator with XRE-family HTH domain n=1 Tax=Amycolatopsis lexingtonensis TaxID=218822 RepID=A0ABR9HT31_9PSEU|nr:Scr1 family TA system antitoxin-like transcriptional regulator [Amycolatopsis lexingtonensis]MBE1494087.1 transcriptional regulator with XRE-family HTH domain [Amycolatopsis lexingtonensis]
MIDNASLSHPSLYVLGRALRQHRNDRGLSLRELARQMGIGPATLSGWEKGERPIPAVRLGWIFGFLKIAATECQLLIRLHAESDRATYVESFDSDVTSLQQAYDRYTLRTFAWAPKVVPAPLQTFDYAHAVLGARAARPDDVDQEILTRQAQKLDRNPHHRYFLVLGAAALTLESVPPEVLQAQLKEITDPGTRRRIETRVVSSEARGASTIEPFMIYETAEKVFTVVLKHEHATIYLSDPATVAHYRSTFKMLHQKAAAYAPGESC